MFGRTFKSVLAIPAYLFHSKSVTALSSRYTLMRNSKLWKICGHPLKNCVPKESHRLHYHAFLAPTIFGVVAFSNSKPIIDFHHQQRPNLSSFQQNFSLSDYLRLSFVSILNRALLFVKTVVHLTQLTLRCSFLCASFGPLLILYPLTMCSKSIENGWFNLLLELIIFAGPTFIKLGQWASTRRDLFSSSFCDILGTLHLDAACHSWTHTSRIMRRAFGENWEDWCKIEFQHPVHSGCIGQVYKGYIDLDMLKAKSGGLLGHSQSLDGRVEVAIKVLHPGVMELVDLDLTIMKFVARCMSLLPGVEWLSLPDIVVEFEQLMKKQIDLKVEAYNLDLFNELFSSDPAIKFPSPIWPLVHSEVLVETFEGGTPISDFMTCSTGSSTTPSQLQRHLAKLGISAILKMVFVNNFVHADLHPGNIIVQYEYEDETTQEGADVLLAAENDLDLRRVRLVFLDAGIIASLSDRDLDNLHKVFTAIVTNRGDIVGELFLEHATANKCKQPEEFKEAMAMLVDDIHNLTLHLGKVQVSGLLSDLFNMLMKHKVKLEGNFSSVMLAIMILEGLGRSLDPQLDIIKEARPILLSGVYTRHRSRPHMQGYQSLH